MHHPKYSVIVPVYNRPDEVDDLLKSLTLQEYKNFEVIIVEDGSSVPCKDVVDSYPNLPITYYSKPNSGPGTTRNYGAERAKGDFHIFFDSDCIIPPSYFVALEKELTENPVDAFGGPDRTHSTFTPIQKAIGYSMTSFFTTGGIRGGKKRLDKFFPRTFNMGISKEVFEKTKGFSTMRFGEDIDFSLRIIKEGFTTRLFPEAYVYHKRRTSFRQFYKQVFNSGIARINLYKLHPNSLKLVHTLPAIFVVASSLAATAAVKYPIIACLHIGYSLLIFLHASILNRSMHVGVLSIAASWIQLFGYGLGFLKATWVRLVRKKEEFRAFDKNFYK